jgi:hypothetical protein
MTLKEWLKGGEKNPKTNKQKLFPAVRDRKTAHGST